MKGVSIDAARAAKARVANAFRGVGDVVGVGLVSVGDGYGLKVNLAEPPGSSVPTEIDGVPVRVEVVGTITKQ
jgi:hypothetical protein